MGYFIHDPVAHVLWLSIGIFAKFADLRGCKPGTVYTPLAYGWCVLFGTLFVLLRRADFDVPIAVYVIALPFGVASVIGGIVFLAGVRFQEKISTSWLIINLSAAIPAVGSIVFYHEHVSPQRIGVVAITAIIFGVPAMERQAIR